MPEFQTRKGGEFPNEMHNETAVRDALQTLHQYVATESDLTKLSELISEINAILDVVDSRMGQD
jgi:hypothetical protein